MTSSSDTRYTKAKYVVLGSIVDDLHRLRRSVDDLWILSRTKRETINALFKKLNDLILSSGPVRPTKVTRTSDFEVTLSFFSCASASAFEIGMTSTQEPEEDTQTRALKDYQKYGPVGTPLTNWMLPKYVSSPVNLDPPIPVVAGDVWLMRTKIGPLALWPAHIHKVMGKIVLVESLGITKSVASYYHQQDVELVHKLGHATNNQELDSILQEAQLGK